MFDALVPPYIQLHTQLFSCSTCRVGRGAADVGVSLSAANLCTSVQRTFLLVRECNSTVLVCNGSLQSPYFSSTFSHAIVFQRFPHVNLLVGAQGTRGLGKESANRGADDDAITR